MYSVVSVRYHSTEWLIQITCLTLAIISTFWFDLPLRKQYLTNIKVEYSFLTKGSGSDVHVSVFGSSFTMISANTSFPTLMRMLYLNLPGVHNILMGLNVNVFENCFRGNVKGFTHPVVGTQPSKYWVYCCGNTQLTLSWYPMTTTTTYMSLLLAKVNRMFPL